MKYSHIGSIHMREQSGIQCKTALTFKMKNPQLFWIICGLLHYTNTVFQVSSQLNEDADAAVTDAITGSTPVSLTTEDSTGDTPVSLITEGSAGSRCTENSCGTELAECVNLEKNYICRCLYGYYFQENTCIIGKAFPLQLTIIAQNLSSEETQRYSAVYHLCQTFFNDTFDNPNDSYVEAVLLQLHSQPVNRRTKEIISADVIAMFTSDATMNKTEFTNRLNNSLDPEQFPNFTSVEPCAFYGCDLNTTTCEDSKNNHPVCTCRSGYYKHSRLDKTCKGCSETCSATNHQLCDLKNSSNPVCKCFPNYVMDKKTKTCKPCSFGYSGDDCKENGELIAVVVGAIAIVLVLSLVGGIIGISLSGKKIYKHDNDKHELIQKNSKEYEESFVDFSKPFVFPTVTMSPKLQETAYPDHYTRYNSGSNNVK